MSVEIVETYDPTERVCTKCKFMENVPGSCHVKCAKVEVAPMVEMLSILASTGPGKESMAGVNLAEGDFLVKRILWPKCGPWPTYYDPSTIQDCDGFQAKVEPNPKP